VARLVRWLDIAIFLGFTAYVLLTAPREGNWYAGLAVAAVCTPFWIAARRQLGASFSVRPDARHLVTTGIYSKIRHPVYVFGTPAVMGALVALLGWGLWSSPSSWCRSRSCARVARRPCSWRSSGRSTSAIVRARGSRTLSA
jgi:protein-S-isoprenylcysteine O-methyltransferase Ste14